MVCQESRLSLSSSSLRRESESCEPPSQRRRVLPETFSGFQVFFKPLVGASVVLWTFRSDTVAKMKELVSAKTGVPENDFEFVYEGHQMEDARTALDYNLGSGSTVHLTHRLRGGGKRTYDEMEEDELFPAVGEAFSIDDGLGAIFGDIGDTGARGSGDPVPAGAPLEELEPTRFDPLDFKYSRRSEVRTFWPAGG